MEEALGVIAVLDDNRPAAQSNQTPQHQQHQQQQQTQPLSQEAIQHQFQVLLEQRQQLELLQQKVTSQIEQLQTQSHSALVEEEIEPTPVKFKPRLPNRKKTTEPTSTTSNSDPNTLSLAATPSLKAPRPKILKKRKQDSSTTTTTEEGDQSTTTATTTTGTNQDGEEPPKKKRATTKQSKKSMELDQQQTQQQDPAAQITTINLNANSSEIAEGEQIQPKNE